MGEDGSQGKCRAREASAWLYADKSMEVLQ